MMTVNQNISILLFGVTFSGKSYYLRKSLLPCFKRIIYFDTQNEIQPGSTIEQRFLKGYQFAHNFAEFEFLYRMNFKQDDFKIICKFTNDEEFQAVDLIWKVGHCSLFFEEIDLVSSSNAGKDTLYRIATKGRHKKINLIGTAQRPSRVSIDLRANAHALITFKQNEDTDIIYFKKISQEKATKLSALKTGEFIVFRGEDKLNELTKRS